MGENDPSHPTQIKKSFKVSEGNKSPLDENQLKLLSIPDTEVITLSNPSGSVKWKELKVGSVIHVENVKPDDTTKIHSEYVLISKSGPRESMEYQLNGGTIYNYYFDFVWTEFGPDLSGYAKTSDVNKKISDLNTKVEANTTYINANSTAINGITGGTIHAGTANSLAEPRTLELNINNGTKDGPNSSITLPLDDYTQEDASVSVSATLTLPDSGVTAGPYSCVSVNAKGIVTSGQQFIAYATNLSGISNLAVGGLAIVDSLE